MTQKTLDGKTDCRGVKGRCTVRFTGKAGDNPQVKEILDGLKNVAEKYPCVKVTVNRKPLKEFQKEWDKEDKEKNSLPTLQANMHVGSMEE